MDEVLERLAEHEHNQWIAWSKQISKSENISKDRLVRWKKLWVPYSKLSEQEKEQDRKWARKALASAMECFCGKKPVKIMFVPCGHVREILWND